MPTAPSSFATITERQIAELVIDQREVWKGLPASSPLKKKTESVLRRLKRYCSTEFPEIPRNATKASLRKLGPARTP
jgi:hypothetical protein